MPNVSILLTVENCFYNVQHKYSSARISEKGRVDGNLFAEALTTSITSCEILASKEIRASCSPSTASSKSAILSTRNANLWFEKNKT